MSHADLMEITHQLDHALAQVDGLRENVNSLETRLDHYRQPVHVVLSRDNAVMLAGWIQAHRPPGDWEPGFLGAALLAIKNAVTPPADPDEEEAF